MTVAAPMRPDTLQRINNAIKVANEFLEPLTDAENFKTQGSEDEFLEVLRDTYYPIIVWLILRRLDQKEQTFQGIEMIVDAMFTQFARFYVYKEVPPSEWTDLKKLAKAFQAVFNREKKFVGKETDRFRAAIRDAKDCMGKYSTYQIYAYLAEIWEKAPTETDNLWKRVRGLT